MFMASGHGEAMRIEDNGQWIGMSEIIGITINHSWLVVWNICCSVYWDQ